MSEEHFTCTDRAQKEQLLKQHSVAIWMTGLSGAGKTTLGLSLEKALFEKGYFVQLLDGDDVRTGLNKNLGYSDEDRTENIRRIAEVNRLFVRSGIITISCFISPTKAIREMAREIIGPENFLEIFVHAPFDVCEKRDVKGHYAKARKGLIKQFTGIDSPYEDPEEPFLDVDTSTDGVEESTQKVLDHILPIIQRDFK